MRFYFVRHADKEDGNFLNPRLSQQDQPISKHGRTQAERLCQYFERKAITASYVSEYVRTQQTIRPLARRMRLTPVIDSRLNEVDRGELDRLSDEQIQEAYPATWEAYRERTEDFRWPGGETGTEAQARIVSFLTERAYSPGDKLAVAHEGIIRLLLCYVLDIPVYRRFIFHLGTTGIVEITQGTDRTGWGVVRLNQELTW